MCSEVEGAPLLELLLIYQIKGFGMQQRKGGEGGKEQSLDNKVDPKSKRVRRLLILIDLGWGSRLLSTCTSHSLLTNPFASSRLGRLRPSLWTDTGRGVCIICLGALGLLCSQNGPTRGEKTGGLRLTQLVHKQLICRGKLQVQGCSIDSGVQSMELLPPPPTSRY